jgi:hypothetical protein
MQEDNSSENMELQPDKALLFAFERAIEATVECLRGAGLDEKSIWAAYEQSLLALIGNSIEFYRIDQPVAGQRRVCASLDECRRR